MKKFIFVAAVVLVLVLVGSSFALTITPSWQSTNNAVWVYADVNEDINVPAYGIIAPPATGVLTVTAVTGLVFTQNVSDRALPAINYPTVFTGQDARFPDKDPNKFSLSIGRFTGKFTTAGTYASIVSLKSSNGGTWFKLYIFSIKEPEGSAG